MTDFFLDHHSDTWLSFAVSYPTERLRVLAAHPERLYKCRDQLVNGKLRPITNPCDELKAIQRLIRERLLLPVPLSPIVYSDIPGRSATQNAEQHLNQPNVASADIRNCYDGMTNAMVFRVFRNTLRRGLPFSDSQASCRSASSRLSHSPRWFQLPPVRSTNLHPLQYSENIR